jgi:hypothetical protein
MFKRQDPPALSETGLRAAPKNLTGTPSPKGGEAPGPRAAWDQVLAADSGLPPEPDTA